jgi:hypothetical protein
LSRCLAAAVLCFCSSLGVLQAQDIHVSIDPAAPIYRSSAFIHGYAHGYEMGFHSGDLELQMGRMAHDPKNFKQFKEAKKFYQKEFGNRDSFTSGYENGFRVGYGDAYQGRNFRGAYEARTLAQQWQSSGVVPEKNSQPDVDSGIEQGYKLGVKSGLDAARNSEPFNLAAAECPAKKTPIFCRAHGLGYELGYSDGYNNQRKPNENVKTASE